MTSTKTKGQVIGYARVSTTAQSLDAQTDALRDAGVDPDRIYSDKLSGVLKRAARPGLTALLDYARPGDVIVVAGVDRLGRDGSEVMTTVKTLADRGIVIRSLREGIDSTTPIGRAIVGILASMAELELELACERREAARKARKDRGQPIGRPKALDPDKAGLARRMRSSGEPVPTIAKTLGVSRATVYRAIAEHETEPSNTKTRRTQRD
jgi:DNA invertase Pin-like site-specific DNA recombinase